MTFEEYMVSVRRTANTGLSAKDALTNAALGLGEAGEAQDIIKKHLFHGHQLDRNALIKELGDQLFYIAWIADQIGSSLDDVAQTNVTKLQRRYEHGFSHVASINRSE